MAQRQAKLGKGIPETENRASMAKRHGERFLSTSVSMRNRIRNYAETLSKGQVVMDFLCYSKKNLIYLYMTNHSRW